MTEARRMPACSVAPAGRADGPVTAGRPALRAAAHAAMVRAAPAVFRRARPRPRVGAGWDAESEADGYEHHDSPHGDLLSAVPIQAPHTALCYVGRLDTVLEGGEGS